MLHDYAPGRMAQMGAANPWAGASRGAAAVCLVLLLGACGTPGGVAGSPTTAATSTPTTPADPASTGPTAHRGAPRWETVTTLTGTGPAEPPSFPILGDSIQWRARWRCEIGRLQITTDPPPRRPLPLVEGACPAKGEGFAIVTGDVRLRIEASGPWAVVVDQQVDTPLREPPFEGFATAAVVGQGPFSPIEKQARGTARLFTRADGTVFLRLEEFEVSNNVDLFVWLSEAVAPKTSADAVAAPHVVLGNLRSTIGDQNYLVPATVPLERVRSVVIWCEPIRIAYGGAPLTP